MCVLYCLFVSILLNVSVCVFLLGVCIACCVYMHICIYVCAKNEHILKELKYSNHSDNFAYDQLANLNIMAKNADMSVVSFV